MVRPSKLLGSLGGQRQGLPGRLIGALVTGRGIFPDIRASFLETLFDSLIENFIALQAHDVGEANKRLLTRINGEAGDDGDEQHHCAKAKEKTSRDFCLI
jgi:hypothetical protein